MPPSDAKKKANRKWNEANKDRYWNCIVMFPAEEKDAVKARAASLGLSVSEYIRGLIHADIESTIR